MGEGRMGMGQIASLQADLRSADRVEMVPMATVGRLDLRSGCPCECVRVCGGTGSGCTAGMCMCACV